MNYVFIYGKGIKFDRINEVLKMYRNKIYMYIKIEWLVGLLEVLFLLLLVNINLLIFSLLNFIKYIFLLCIYFYILMKISN